MPLLPSPLKGVLFDMDGVILDSMGHHEAAWRRILAEYGVPVTPVDIYRREGMSGVASVREIFIEKGMDAPTEMELVTLIDKKHEIFSDYNIEVFEGIKPVIAALDMMDIKLGLVTGSHRETVSTFLPADIAGRFSVLISSDDVHEGKPSPEPYLKALERLGVNRENALVIENAPMGIASAVNAGIFCIAIETTLPEEYLQKADIVVKDHKELEKLLLG